MAAHLLYGNVPLQKALRNCDCLSGVFMQVTQTHQRLVKMTLRFKSLDALERFNDLQLFELIDHVLPWHRGKPLVERLQRKISAMLIDYTYRFINRLNGLFQHIQIE